MPNFKTGTVAEIHESLEGLDRITVTVDDKARKAVNYPTMTGSVKVGDKVVVNTTAVDMDLGTGGQDFVLWNLERTEFSQPSGGHIMKLRYTPCQVDVMTAEAPESSHHDTLAHTVSIDGMPVVACGLHSQIAPAAAMLKMADPDVRIAYLMTDAACLPIAQSNLVRQMKDKGLIDATVTCGHAFGGDYEAVNIFSGLATACDIAAADITIAAMGPGATGTGTALGHGAMEQGQLISATGALGGRPVATLRISFADERPRHQGLSHQTVTALRYGAAVRSTMAVPDLPIEQLSVVMNRLIETGLTEMHDVKIVDSFETEMALGKFGLESVTTMGRSLQQDLHFFEAAGAAGMFAGQLLYQTDE